MNRSERGSSAQTTTSSNMPHSASSGIPNAAVSNNSTSSTPTTTSSSSPYMSVRYKRHHHHHHPYRRNSSGARSAWWRNPCVIFLLSFAAIGSLRFRVPARSRNAASQLITKQREKRAAARLRQHQDEQEENIISSETDPCQIHSQTSMSSKSNSNCTTSSSSAAASVSAVRYTLVEEGHEEDSSKRAFQKYRVLLTNTDQPITVQRWAELMMSSSSQALDNNAVLAGLVQTIRDAPYDAVFFETPPVVALTAASQPFEFVLVDAPRLHAATLERADPHTFAAHFAADQHHSESNPWAVAFDNLSGDARLIAPRPPPTKDKSRRYYAHLASFCRQAPDERIAAVWRLAAQEYLDRIFQAAAASPVWFSTSGLGVAWLHLRLDAVPKYYTYLPYTHPRQEDE